MRPEDLRWSADALGASADAVQVRWLGTASFAIEYAGAVLLIDPYITRAPLHTCVFTKLQPDLAAIRRLVPRADAIVAGHTHFDHVLDVPEIARHTGAKVFGSRSCELLCRSSGIPEAQVVMVERGPGEAIVETEVGPFHLKFLPSKHSAFLFGKVPFPGEIADCDQVPLRTKRYRCGAVFAVEISVGGKRLLHLGSADLVESTVTSRQADLLLQCVAGWRASEALPERLIRTLDPKAILLSHWDNFFVSLERPASVLPAIGFSEFAERLLAERRDLKLGTIPIHGSVRV